MRSLFATLRREFLERGDAASGVLDKVLSVVDLLVAKKHEKFRRVLPLADYFVDRWDKARALGFGDGTSIYDSSLVIGDVEMGKNCWVGPFTVIDGSGGLVIGDACTFSAGSQVYTHDSIRATLEGAAIERSPVRIGHRVYVGPNAVVVRGVTIGDDVVIGANSVVLADVPSGARVAGNPARILRETSS